MERERVKQHRAYAFCSRSASARERERRSPSPAAAYNCRQGGQLHDKAKVLGCWGGCNSAFRPLWGTTASSSSTVRGRSCQFGAMYAKASLFPWPRGASRLPSAQRAQGRTLRQITRQRGRPMGPPHCCKHTAAWSSVHQSKVEPPHMLPRHGQGVGERHAALDASSIVVACIPALPSGANPFM